MRKISILLYNLQYSLQYILAHNLNRISLYNKCISCYELCEYINTVIIISCWNHFIRPLYYMSRWWQCGERSMMGIQDIAHEHSGWEMLSKWIEISTMWKLTCGKFFNGAQIAAQNIDCRLKSICLCVCLSLCVRYEKCEMILS